MTIFFHDVSNYQGSMYEPTGPTIIKATEGLTFNDADYTITRDRCEAAGDPFLPYHFLRSGNISEQVTHVRNVLGTDRTIMVDVETENGMWPSLVETQQFIDLHGHVTLAYIPHWFWAGEWASSDLTWLTQRGIGLISSDYIAYSDDGPGWAAYGGVTPIIWQYTSTPLDSNAYKGTIVQLGQLFQGGIMTTPDPVSAVVVGESQLYDHAAKRDTPTGRNFANDVYAVVEAGLAGRFDAIDTAVAALGNRLDAATIATAVVAALTAGGYIAPPNTLQVTLTGTATPQK
jgi:hypothetical protein